MKIVDLIRMERTTEYTLGVLMINTLIHSFCIEPPWRMNRQFASCIPTGSYICKYHYEYGDYVTYEVKDVEDRDSILFHIGNTVVDTEGCICPGLKVGYLNNRRAVLNSSSAFHSFINAVGAPYDFTLTIKEAS